MLVIYLWTAVAVLLAVLCAVVVVAIGLHMRDEMPAPAPFDPFAQVVASDFRAEDTRTGRVRLMLTSMAHREADQLGVAREPIGAHRATP